MTTETNQLEKMLIVNDDTGDILAMQSRLPQGVQVLGASQFQASLLQDLNFDVIVLDNDANNLRESKGAQTLKEIRQRNPNVPVLYTSFQPGWVPGEVYQTRNVRVVPTSEALEEISKRFGISLVERERKAESGEPQTSIILTYNPVDGYEQGVYSNDRLLIVSYEKNAEIHAKRVLADSMRKIYEKFDWSADRDMIRNIFVYDGINGGTVSGRSAISLGHDVRMKVNLMACRCGWDRKQQLADSCYINLFQVECGGRETLGAVADVLLGVKRPEIDYAKLSIPLEKINSVAERFRI
jgi:hypothetical protein